MLAAWTLIFLINACNSCLLGCSCSWIVPFKRQSLAVRLHVESLHTYARLPSTTTSTTSSIHVTVGTPPFPLALQPNRQKWSCPRLHIVEWIEPASGKCCKGQLVLFISNRGVRTYCHRDTLDVLNSPSAQCILVVISRLQRARRYKQLNCHPANSIQRSRRLGATNGDQVPRYNFGS